jgi:tetratricopeptide (TPR) repeat protein
MKTARRSFRLSAACVLGLGVALSSAGASAQTTPPPGSTAVAEGLFQQARDLFKQQQYAEACPRFAESLRLEPKLGTLLNLAVCHEKLGKIATAWAEYTSAATIARRDGAKDREDFARDQVAALGAKIARVSLQIAAPPADLVVSLDGQPLDHTALNTPLPVDPGTHRIAATAPGKIAWSTTIEAPSARAEIPVAIPALEAAIEPAPPPIAAPPPAIVPAPIVAPAAPQGPAVAPPLERDDHRILIYGGFGVGAVGVLVGAITGAVTLAQAASIRDACTDHVCAASQTDALGSATTLANVSNVSFVVGALGVGTGVVGLLLSQPHAAAPKAALTVTPTLGPGSIGLHGTF